MSTDKAFDFDAAQEFLIETFNLSVAGARHPHSSRELKREATMTAIETIRAAADLERLRAEKEDKGHIKNVKLFDKKA